MLATENLYLAAWARAQGARLARVIVTRSNGRNTGVFELDCATESAVSAAYYDGSAVVNLADYRRHLEELKDELFDALRENERRRDDERAHTNTRRASARR